MSEGRTSQPRPLTAWFVAFIMTATILCAVDFGIPVAGASSRALVTDLEPNDSYVQAQPIVLNDIVKGSLEINNDNKDVYKVHIEAGTVINLSFVQKEWNPAVTTEYDANVEFIGPLPVHSLVRRENKHLHIETLSALCIEHGDYFVWMYLASGSKPVNYTMNIANQTPQVIGRVQDLPGTLDATDSLAGTNPNIWYKLSIPPTKGIQVTLSVPKGSDFDIFALDQWDRLPFYYPGHRNPLWLNASTDNSSAGNFEFLKAIAWEGQYWLRIKAWPGSKGQYKLTVIDFDPVETDLNNLPNEAIVVNKKMEREDHLQFSLDHFDWFKIPMLKGQKVNITMTLLTNTYDIYNMSIYDQNQAFVKGVFDTQTGDTYNDTNLVDSTCNIDNFVAPSSQDYYVLVYPIRDINQQEQATFKPLDSTYRIMFDLMDKGPVNNLDIAPIVFPEDTVFTGLDVSDYFQDPEGDPLTYSFTPTYAPNLTIAMTPEGLVTITPKADWNTGTTTLPITFRAEDAWTNTGPNFDVAQTTIKVSPVNDKPSSSGTIPAVTFNETEVIDVPLSMYKIFKDIDDQNFTFTVTDNGTIPVVIDNTEGKITLGPVDGWFGTVVINVTAHDSGGLTAWSNFSATVLHKNHAPTVVGASERYLNITEDQQDVQVLVTPWFTDRDIVYAQDQLTCSIGTPLPSNLMTTNENGLIKIIPLAEWHGTDIIWVVAKDKAKVEIKVKLIVTVTAVNDPPKIISSLPILRDESINEGDNETFKVTLVTDPDTNASDLTYKWYIEGAVQNISGSEMEFTTDFDDSTPTRSSGIYHIEVEVSDGQYSEKLQWNLTVVDINQLPQNVNIFSPTQNAVFKTGQKIEFKADPATDIDGDPISYTWKNAATGETLGTGPTITVATLKKGTYKINLVVSDGVVGHEVTKSVDITVKAKKKPAGFIPGFEAAFMLMALAVGLALVSRRLRK